MIQGVKMLLSEVRWACRRGMLELDILLGRFLEEAFPGLDPEKQAVFVKLLETADPVLFAWLTGKETAPDSDVAHMIQHIRDHATHRH